MRERPLPPMRGSAQSIEERRALKPDAGDVVKYQEQTYVVTAVGNRYVNAYEEGGDPRFTKMLPLQYVIKTGRRVTNPPQ